MDSLVAARNGCFYAGFNENNAGLKEKSYEFHKANRQISTDIGQRANLLSEIIKRVSTEMTRVRKIIAQRVKICHLT